jgi:hypothetical protein
MGNHRLWQTGWGGVEYAEVLPIQTYHRLAEHPTLPEHHRPGPCEAPLYPMPLQSTENLCPSFQVRRGALGLLFGTWVSLKIKSVICAH